MSRHTYSRHPLSSSRQRSHDPALYLATTSCKLEIYFILLIVKNLINTFFICKIDKKEMSF